MRVIYFTEGAGDPMRGSRMRGLTLIPLLESDATTQVACMHLAKGARWQTRLVAVTTALLVIYGRVHFIAHCHIDLSTGTGAVMEPGEQFELTTEAGAVLFLVEGRELAATEIAVSTPMRMMGERWPGET